MKNRMLWAWVAALCLTGVARSPIAAQGTIIHACYVPLVGVVYRIKEPNLPQACLAPFHVEFQWNSQGLKGDKGDPGSPATLPFAGQSCPSGYFVAGFSAAGGLICRNVDGQETTPPPPPASELYGTWSLNPQLTSSCSFGSLVLTGMVTSGTATSMSVTFTATVFNTAVPNFATIGPIT